MHIVFFSSVYPGPHKVRGSYLQTLVRALSQAHQVTVVVPTMDRFTNLWHAANPVERDGRLMIHRPRYWHRRGVWWGFYLLSCFRWSRTIDWSSVDVIHANWSIPSGFAAALLCRWYKKPFVLTEHMGDVDTWLSSLPRHITIHWTIKQAARLLTVSKTLQRRIERHGIVARAAMSLPNVFDPTLFHPDPSYHREPASPLHLLWVGGFKPDYYRRKGGPDLLHAVALAYPHLKQAICLTLIGGGPARGECETLARNLGIADTCHFLGELPYTQVRDQMQHCDALVLASLSESFGAVIIEAMACGKPVIATRCGGPEEIVTPETGLLIEPGDKQALAEAIIELSTTIEAYDPEHIVAHVYRHYHPERVANKLTHVYNEVRHL